MALIEQTKRLETITTEEVDRASQAMRKAIDTVAGSFDTQARVASDRARRVRHDASWMLTGFVGIIAVATIVMGVFVASQIAGPIKRLTRVVRAIADGETGRAVPGTDARDEVGQMARSVEALRAVMRQTFL